MRNLVLVLGDQLDVHSAALRDLDPACDAVWMAEVAQETTHVWCHKLRIALFFSAMRHFRDELRGRGISVHYTAIPVDPAEDCGRSFADLLALDVRELGPQRLIVLQPGDHRVEAMLHANANDLGLDLDVRDDDHFLCDLTDFQEWFEGRRHVLQEHFYRWQRKRHRVLLTRDGKPVGGQWNFDHDNRESFGRDGPPMQKPPIAFPPDTITREVIQLVEQRFASHPGSTEHFDLPVTRPDAVRYLRDFVEHRLPLFGTFEDAMWTGEPVLFHSRLSAALNLHLLRPQECVDAAVAAYEAGDAPLNAVEGFVRQILGWREFVRGVYFAVGPEYLDRNALDCDPDTDVPDAYWTGDTDMRCVGEVMRGVLDHAYSHHIPRLMVMGNFAMLLGVHPRRFHDWHMAMYADAIDWVSAPNTIGMASFGDGGIVGTKPYAASGAYINRMSNFCRQCPYDPKLAVGETACPVTTMYWDFLDRHADRFADNRRMAFQMKNLQRKRDRGEMTDIRKHAETLRKSLLV